MIYTTISSSSLLLHRLSQSTGLRNSVITGHAAAATSTKAITAKSCGLERELLRSLFILHKPADAVGKLDKKLKKNKEQVDKEEQQHADKESRRKAREASGEDLDKVVPIETDDGDEDALTSQPAKEEKWCYCF